jgi:phosphohistidine phosphatase
MKTLLLLRHAKSRKETGNHDAERPLSPRGERVAELLAHYLAQRKVTPSFALVSTARRTLETLEPIQRRIGLPHAAERALYLADAATLRERLARLDDRDDCVLLVGHNPGLHDLALELAGNGDGKALARLRERFPTGSLAVLDFALDSWEGLVPGSGTLVELTTPEDLV